MIKGIGCDIVEHELTSKLGWDQNPALLSRVFSEKEKEQINPTQKIRFMSGRFAAKEAILKSLGTIMEDGISLTDIQVFQQKNGKPVVSLNGRIKEIADSQGIMSVHISISHSNNYSIAYAIAEGKTLS
jgi:holo-[acyl-carrier protein] synthase